MKNYPKVLIVDDDNFSRNLLRIVLRSKSYEVVGDAYNGREALDRIKELSPDIVLMDILMPEMDGIEALKQLKQTNPEILVLMITGDPSFDNIERSTMNGAAGVIVKPYTEAALLNTLKAVQSESNQ